MRLPIPSLGTSFGETPDQRSDHGGHLWRLGHDLWRNAQLLEHPRARWTDGGDEDARPQSSEQALLATNLNRDRHQIPRLDLRGECGGSERSHAGGKDEYRGRLGPYPVEHRGHLASRGAAMLAHRRNADRHASAATHERGDLLGEPGLEERDALSVQLLRHAAANPPPRRG